MRSLVCILEEPSAREMLEQVLPKLVPEGFDFKYMVFEGKQDLEKQIEKRMRFWKLPETVFLVMRDQDSGDCKIIKKNLQKKVEKSGKEEVTLIRIACRELESFFLGDLEAIAKAFKLNGLQRQQGKKRFRNTDNLGNPVQELNKLTKMKYQKIAGSRAIGAYMRIDGESKSHSFNVLLSGIRKLTNNGPTN